MALFRKKSGPRSAGMSPVKAGLIGLAVIIVLTFFGFTRYNPFANPFTLKAAVRSANNIAPDSPVRIAGVLVGKVTKVDPMPGGTGGAEVTMQIDPVGLPIHQDAQLKIRPRIFLEGNFFVDLQPGSPSAPNFKSGDTVPVQQTATPVQFGQVLGALQSDTRANLQTLLKEYAQKGLGNGGAQALNRTLDNSPEALRNASIANDATLGQQPHDLSNLERGQQRLAKSLSTNPQTLEDLVTQLDTTFGALASQDTALAATVPALRDTLRAGTPALQSVDAALPAVRTFATTALPGTVSSGPTIDASLPLVTQLQLLVRPQELRGLAADLRPTIPALAQLNADAIPLLNENRALSACQNNVLLPFSNKPIPNPDFPAISGQTFTKAANRTFVGLAGETRWNDANTPMIHGNPGSGATTVVTVDQGKSYFAQAPAPPEGVRPSKPDHRPNFRPGQPCEKQVIPDLNAPGGAASRSVTETIPGGLLPPLPGVPALAKVAALGKIQVNETQDYLQRQRAGRPAIDPISTPQPIYLQKMKQLGYGVTSLGKVYALPGGSAK